MRVTCCAALAMGIILFAGCGDKVTNIYNSSELTGISGLLSPPDGGTVVATAGEQYASAIDDQGYFQLIGLKPGAYQLSVHPNHHTRRELNAIVVIPGSVNFMFVPVTNYPYPITSFYPADSAQGIYPGNTIDLATDEALNLGDLAAGVQIDPPASGRWTLILPSSGIKIPTGSAGQFRYQFIPDNGFEAGTTYHVTVSASVRTDAGAPLGRDLTFHFSTVASKPTGPLMAKLYLSSNSLTGGVALTEFRPVLSFNGCVFPDSLRLAVTIMPDVEGIWTTSGTCHDGYSMVEIGDDQPSTTATGTQFTLFPIHGVPLQAETKYSLVVSDSVFLTGSGHLPAPDTFRFTTEPYGVTAVSPPPWVTSQSPFQTVSLKFNTEMDSASVQPAFMLREVDGPVVAGRFIWDGTRSMIFDPDNKLRSGVSYLISLSRQARRATGESLSHDFESYFAVR
ncbi:MAG: Ig-like domain-containing protein [candidate division Zixibacteria bacterium]|nr:Ig-like domain-containing protein [candidate division Zixibacteria bacterium]